MLDSIHYQIHTSQPLLTFRNINHSLTGCPGKESAAGRGVPPLEAAGPEQPPRVGPRLVHLPPPRPPPAPAQRRRALGVARAGRGRQQLRAAVAGVIGSRSPGYRGTRHPGLGGKRR